MGRIRNIFAGVALAGLVACGDTLPEQAALGAAAGAGAAIVTSGSLLQGAVIGAGANVLACQTDLVRRCR